MQDILINQGVDLMLYGMGTVMVFLAILVIATLVMSWLIQHVFPDRPAVEVQADPLAETLPAYPDAKLLAVIKAAIEQYRNQHR